MFTRFIALGDSMTEGMSDEQINGKYRGWADRVADVLAEGNPNFTYMNLAIRGKLVGQVARDQVPVALKYVEGRSTLLSFHAGANDVLRPKYNPESVIEEYSETVRFLAKSGAQLMLFCVLEDTGEKTKRAKIWQERFRVFNENVRAMADEVGAILLDPNHDSFWRDPRFIASDKLHLNAEGHRRVAQGVLERLGAPHDPDWRRPLTGRARPIAPIRIAKDLWWFLTFGIPWIIRRLRGRSSGDGRRAKYETPIKWPSRNTH